MSSILSVQPLPKRGLARPPLHGRAALWTRARERVLLAIELQPGCSRRDIAVALGVDESTVCYHVRRLTRAGIVVVRKHGRCLAHYLPGGARA